MISGGGAALPSFGPASNANTTLMGVPQGLILGPLLFLVFVNNFHNSLKCGNVIIYADDTSLYINDKNVRKL